MKIKRPNLLSIILGELLILCFATCLILGIWNLNTLDDSTLPMAWQNIIQYFNKTKIMLSIIICILSLLTLYSSIISIIKIHKKKNVAK